MNTKIFITILLLMAAIISNAQVSRPKILTDESSSIRPIVSYNDGELDRDRELYQRRSAVKSNARSDDSDGTFYPYYVSSKSLIVRSAPSHEAPVLKTVPSGEVVYLANGENYPWKRMKVTYFDTEQWEYQTTFGYVDGSMVRAWSQRGQSVNVNVADRRPVEKKGRVTIWTDCDDDGYIDVYVDGNYVGVIQTCFYKKSPVCGEDGTLVVETFEGKHEIAAFGSTKIWKGQITISPDGCALKRLSAM